MQLLVPKRQNHRRYIFTALILFVVVITVMVVVAHYSLPTRITPNQAIEEARNLPEVKDFMQEVGTLSDGSPDKIIEVGNMGPKLTEDQRSWKVHVYFINEFISPDTKMPDDYIGARAMTNTFRWFQVDRCTGKVVCAEVTNVNLPDLPVCKTN